MTQNSRQRSNVKNNYSKKNLELYTRSFKTQKLLQIQVGYSGRSTLKPYESPYYINVCAANGHPNGYKVKKPFGINLKFSLHELEAFALAIELAAKNITTLGVYKKYADPKKAGFDEGPKGITVEPDVDRKKGHPIVKVMFSLNPTPVEQNILKSEMKDAKFHSVAITYDAYQAIGVASSIRDLVHKISDLDFAQRVDMADFDHFDKMRAKAEQTTSQAFYSQGRHDGDFSDDMPPDAWPGDYHAGNAPVSAAPATRQSYARSQPPAPAKRPVPAPVPVTQAIAQRQNPTPPPGPVSPPQRPNLVPQDGSYATYGNYYQ